jgi:hypothetical protein
MTLPPRGTYALLHRYSGQDDILVGTPMLKPIAP